MPEKSDGNGSQGAAGSGVSKLGEALKGYARARAGRYVKAAEGKVAEVTERLSEAAGGGGAVSRAGARVLQGESPVKAVTDEGGRKLEGVKDSVKENVKENVGGTAKAAMGLGGGGGGGGAGKAGDKKVTNIVETLDIGLPLRTCYNHWTEFENFSDFMKGVVDARRSDDGDGGGDGDDGGGGDGTESDWKLKIAFSNRSWKATVQEQVPDDRIVWTSEGDKGTTHGVVSFHELAPRLTRIVVVVEYTPAGFFEKTGNLWRAQGRRLRLDLKHFQRYVSLGAEEEPEGWRGEIRDGEVVRSHEQALEEENEGDGESGEGAGSSGEGDDRGDRGGGGFYDDGDEFDEEGDEGDGEGYEEGSDYGEGRGGRGEGQEGSRRRG